MAFLRIIIPLQPFFAHDLFPKSDLSGRQRNANVLAPFRRGTLAVISGGAAIATPTLAQTGKPMTTPSGLQIIDSKVGQTCVMHYTGWLYENGAKGKKFDSSVDRGEPFEFKIGLRQVIAGWDEGVASMKVGGKRTLIIPAALGYGAQGAGNAIPPNATLMFDVELLGIK
jgi:peptidylprolyl isomerase